MYDDAAEAMLTSHPSPSPTAPFSFLAALSSSLLKPPLTRVTHVVSSAQSPQLGFLQAASWSHCRVEPPYRHVRAAHVGTLPRVPGERPEAEVAKALAQLKVTSAQRIARSLFNSGGYNDDAGGLGLALPG